MKAVEFEAMMSQDGEIVLPSEFLGEVPAGEQLKVVVMWDASGVDAAWRATGRIGFEEAYCAEDAIYDELNREA